MLAVSSQDFFPTKQGYSKVYPQTSKLEMQILAPHPRTVHVWLLVMSDSVTPWPVALQAPLSMGFSRQEYWNGLPFPPPGNLPVSGTEPASPALAGGFFFFFYH